MAIEVKNVAPNVEIVWNPVDNSGLVRFIARGFTILDGQIVGGSVAAGMEERTFAHLEARGFDVAGVMQQFKDAFDAVWEERNTPTPEPEPEPLYTGDPSPQPEE